MTPAQYLRRTNLALLNQSTPLASESCAYDSASRLQTVSDGNNNAATYSYLANSPLVSQIAFTNSGSWRMTTTKQYDLLNRLTQISTVDSGLRTVDSHSYTYSPANQRVRTTLADGSSWLYTYDSLGQVISGRKYWPNQTPVAGQQFEYAFDDIGNRKSTKAGGDENGANLRSAGYSAEFAQPYHQPGRARGRGHHGHCPGDERRDGQRPDNLPQRRVFPQGTERREHEHPGLARRDQRCSRRNHRDRQSIRPQNPRNSSTMTPTATC